MSFLSAMLVAQAVASGMMAGIIWFVQVVHYPLFAAAAPNDGGGYALENQRRTAPVVLPPMLVEAAAAAWLVVAPPAAIGRATAVVGLVMVGLLWASTLGVQMPLHGRLAREGHAPAIVAALVRSNWLRTLLWTARAVLAAWMLAVAG